MSACRSCSAEITFARMATSGKMSPFERDDAGEWVIVGGIASHQGKAPDPPIPTAAVQRWTSHFARCAQAAKWRRR